MPKTKISEFSATPANNTDIDSINIAEGCAPSGINDAIRELMAQLKDFQTGAVGDSFNGPVGTSTAAAGAFTTLSASSTATLSGLTASTALALDASKNIVSVTNTGTGSNVLATSPTLVTPILGTPTSATLTNATGLPIATGVSGLGTGVATFLATPSSANLAAALTDETGSGANVFATSPTLVTPILGTPTSATLTNATGLPISTGVSGLGTGIATALAVNVGSSGAPLVNGGVLGTPSSGTATNLTGLPLTTGVTGTLPTTNGGTNLTSFTSGGVVYASSGSALATGSGLNYASSTLTVNNILAASNGTNIINVDSPSQQIASFVSGVGYGTLNLNATPVIFQIAGTEGMRLTSTGLGIGTSSPAYKLEVNATSGTIARFRGTGNYGQVVADNTNSTGGGVFIASQNGVAQSYFGVEGAILGSTSANTGIFNNVAGTSINFYTNASAVAKATIDSAGNLGLGVTPSAWVLLKAFEFGTGTANGSLYGYDNEVGLSTNVYYNSGYKYISTGAASQYRQSSGIHAWYNAPSGTAGNAISFTQALTLDASGNLLCGNTSLPTSYGATSGVINTTGGVWTNRGQFSAAGSTTTTFLTLANASNNQSYIVSVRQSGAGGNFVSAFVIAYGASATSIRFAQDNTNAALDMNITTSGLALRLVLASGFGTTTWDWVITRLG